MKFPRRQFLHLAAGVAAVPVVSRIARAQTYPTRPVRIIVGFPAGQASDGIARLVGHVWTAPTGQEVLLAFCLQSGASHVSGLFVRRS